MMNSLDLLIVVVLSLFAIALVSTVLMFLVRNRTFKRVCLYLAAALGLYMAGVGLYIGWPMYLGQALTALLAGAASIGAVVLERRSGENGKRFLTAQIMAAAALFAGLYNAFL